MIKVLFVASEMAPIAKVGGLGDVIGSLPKALSKIGVDIAVILPRYEQIPLRELKQVAKIDAQTILYSKKVGGVKVFFIDNRKYLSRGPIYFDRTAFADSKKEFDRFVFFSKAVFQLLSRGILKTDIIHANDWHSGLVVKLLQADSCQLKARTVFTIHNLANQGKRGKDNLMAEGIKNADMITTVSPTYAKEILTKEYGEGLDGRLRKRFKKGELRGILNGVDYTFWPIQKRNKIAFQKKLGLTVNSQAPIFGLVSRLTDQKGINLITPLIGGLIWRYGAQFIFLGQGKKQLEDALRLAAKRYPKNVFTKIGFDEHLSHAIYSQSDFFLMPSRFEPCGLGQMIAMHYGTIPIVRATGGLQDTVRHRMTGLVFEETKPLALAAVIRVGLGIYKNSESLERMRQHCRRQDFSWDKSAEQYKKLYLHLIRAK